MIKGPFNTIKLLVITTSLWCTKTWANDFLNMQLALMSQIASVVQGDDQSKSTSTSTTTGTGTTPTTGITPATPPTGAATTTATTATATTSTTPEKKKPEILKFAEPISSLDINVEDKYMNAPEIKKLHRLLGIKNKKYRVIYLVNNKPLGRFDLDDNIIAVQTRSFVNIMDFLSNGVQVPPEALEAGVVLTPKYPDGEYYDLTELTKGLFCVHLSYKRPQHNVNVEVYYRNHWFYIADTDIQSKRTLALVQQIFNFLSGTVKTSMGSPILTIPVA